MKPKLIVMLTNEDKTVPDAIEIFKECCDLPVDIWGFKNVGITEERMSKLITMMKRDRKKTALEVVTYTEESCMEAAKFACEHNFDYLLGTCYFDSVWNYLKKHTIKYYPFIGNVFGHPSSLTGDLKSMISEANKFRQKNISGVDCLAFRYSDGNPVLLAKSIVQQIKSDVIIAGSINTIERINIVKSINPWGFTIGSAIYKQNFLNGAGYRANLEKVLEIINES